MIYVYDNAICDDLKHSFNSDVVGDVVVKVVAPENIVELAAQIQNDEISFPLIALVRNGDFKIDTDRMNFTRAHKGVASVIDPDTNELYYEKVLPIKLSYTLNILTTNTADMDELVRELTFKYINQYFITLQLPYECKRKIRFGVTIVPGEEFGSDSGSSEYTKSGKIYQSAIPLSCEGCVLVSYTPAKLKQGTVDIEVK